MISIHPDKSCPVSVVVCLLTALAVLFVVSGCGVTEVEERVSLESPELPDKQPENDPFAIYYLGYYEMRVEGEVVGTQEHIMKGGEGAEVYEEYGYDVYGIDETEVIITTGGELVKSKYTFAISSIGVENAWSDFKKSYSEEGSTFNLHVRTDQDPKECLIIEPDVAGCISCLCSILSSGFEEKTMQVVIPSLGLEKRQLTARLYDEKWDYHDPECGDSAFKYVMTIPSAGLEIIAYRNPESGILLRFEVPSMNLEVNEVEKPLVE